MLYPVSLPGLVVSLLNSLLYFFITSFIVFLCCTVFRANANAVPAWMRASSLGSTAKTKTSAKQTNTAASLANVLTLAPPPHPPNNATARQATLAMKGCPSRLATPTGLPLELATGSQS